MTRIIKKSKKKRVVEQEVEPIEEGKDLSQSGNFFQNNKSLITWILVLAFAATCIGVTSMTSCTGKTPNQIETEQIEKDRKNPKKQLENAKKDLDSADTLENNVRYAYECEVYANSLMSEVFAKFFIGSENNDKDKQVANREVSQAELIAKQNDFDHYRDEALKHYEIVVKRMDGDGKDNSNIADYSEIDRNYSDLSKLYIQKEEYQKVIDLALKDKNVKEILDSPKDKIEETAKKLIETETPDKLVIENLDFIPLLSNYIIAKANTGKFSEVEKFVDVAMKYDDTNILLIFLVIQKDIDNNKLDEAERLVEEAGNIFNNTFTVYASSVANKREDKDEDNQTATIPYDYIISYPMLYSLKGDIEMKKNNKPQAAMIYSQGSQIAAMLGNGKFAEELNKKMEETGIIIKTVPKTESKDNEQPKEEQKEEATK